MAAASTVRTFKARFESTCHVCSDEIHPGQLVHGKPPAGPSERWELTCDFCVSPKAKFALKRMCPMSMLDNEGNFLSPEPGSDEQLFFEENMIDWICYLQKRLDRLGAPFEGHIPASQERVVQSILRQYERKGQETLELFQDWAIRAAEIFATSAKRRKRAAQCFLPFTLFHVGDGIYKAVEFLSVGDTVLDCHGTETQIVRYQQLPRHQATIVELRTRSTSLKVSSQHRIPLADGSEKLAGDVTVGDRVLCGGRPQPLTRVVHHQRVTELYDLGFKPDVPIESSLALQWNIASKGSNSGLHLSPTNEAGGEDQLSIPDTECSYE